MTYGIRDLQDVLINDYGLAAEVAGWDLIVADKISGDGNVIVGAGVNPAGVVDRWVIDFNAVPEPSSLLLALFALLPLLPLARFARRRRAA